MNDKTRITDEEALLLRLCRLEFSEAQVNEIRALASGIAGWDYFRSLANAHGVAALVYHNLEKHNLLPGIPEEVVAFLRGTLMRSLSRNAFSTETMGEVLRLLNEEGIKTVLLKGLALELTIFGNAGLRQMTDVDILISREQSLKARDILISHGFISLPVKSLFHEHIIIDIGKHLPSLIRNGTSVEIHHELFGDSNKVLTKMLYDNSYDIRIKGERVFIPPPQLFFLYLVRHLSLHEMNNESQLRLYTDLVVLITKHTDEIINYDLLSYASQAGMAEILARYLELLRDIWSIPFPGWIDEFIERWHTPDTINKFLFFLKSPKDNPPLDKAGVYRHVIGQIPGLRSKLLFLLGDIFPTIAFMKKRYRCSSTWRVLFYYPHRLGKILWMVWR
jgi:hypothetical protein